MKKILICFFILILLSSCSQRTQSCDISEFSENINIIYGYEMIDEDDIYISEQEKNKAFWFPENDKNCCVSFYLNGETGAIEKCCVSIKDRKNMKLSEIIISVLKNCDKYFEETKYETDKYLLITFYDTRYAEKSTSPTLKKYIKEQDLY